MNGQPERSRVAQTRRHKHARLEQNTEQRGESDASRGTRSSFVIHIPRPTIRPTIPASRSVDGRSGRSFPASSLRRLRVPCLRVMTDKQCHVMMMTAVSVSRTEKRRASERAHWPPPSNIYVSSDRGGNGGQNVKCIMFRPGGRGRPRPSAAVTMAMRGRMHLVTGRSAERSCHADNERVPITASSVDPFHN